VVGILIAGNQELSKVYRGAPLSADLPMNQELVPYYRSCYQENGMKTCLSELLSAELLTPRGPEVISDFGLSILNFDWRRKGSERSSVR